MIWIYLICTASKKYHGSQLTTCNEPYMWNKSRVYICIKKPFIFVFNPLSYRYPMKAVTVKGYFKCWFFNVHQSFWSSKVIEILNVMKTISFTVKQSGWQESKSKSENYNLIAKTLNFSFTLEVLEIFSFFFPFQFLFYTAITILSTHTSRNSDIHR